MTTSSEFFQAGDDCDPGYKNVRDLAHHSDDKAFVESLWNIYRPHADPHFQSDACRHFNERFWEMYLGCTLMDRGFDISSEGVAGPEFYSMIQNQRCWFEAISPSAGNGPDAVPELEMGALMATRVPGDEITLRLRHAIYEKHKKYLCDCEAGLIAADEPYIICINSKRISTIVSNPDVPFIVKAVFPIGDLTVEIDRHKGHIVNSFHSYRGEITKKSGAPVSTDVFQDAAYAGISAILYSSVDCANYPRSFGRDFIVVHNPLATNKVSRRLLNFGMEYWVEGNDLHWE